MNILDTYYATKFLYLLTRPWEETSAFRLGVIDENGKRNKEVALDTKERKDAYDLFTRLVFNIKRLLEKLPLGATTIARYATALKLIKESVGHSLEPVLLEHLKAQGIVLPREAHHYDLSENAEYEEWLGYLFVEDMNVTGGIDGVDAPLGKKPSRRKKLKLAPKLPLEVTESTDEFFGGDMVFTVSGDVFEKAKHGKKPYMHYKSFVGEDSVGKTIRGYANKYPGKSIILKHASTGAMFYFKNKKK